jgi:hypothetical protein
LPAPSASSPASIPSGVSSCLSPSCSLCSL